jgi:diguanylate cyclase (GGDEF)-like protein
VRGEASRLLDAARGLHQTLDPSRLLVRVCEEAKRLVDAERADVYLGGAARRLRLEATWGRAGVAIGGGVAPGEGAIGAAAERGEPVREGPLLAVPLRWDGELRGVLAVELPGERSPTDPEAELLESFAELAGAACRNAAEHGRLALAARTDGLTGCLNHAAMQETLRRELERARRTGSGLSLAIVDLDDFKQVNEMHGHQAGDEVLKHVGAALRDSVRAYDVVARYGGDEFVIIALDAGEEVAADVVARGLEEMRGRLAVLGFGEEVTLATAGVAGSVPGDSPTMLIARADEALLYGKHEGPRGTAIRASSVPEGYVEGRSGGTQ